MLSTIDIVELVFIIILSIMNVVNIIVSEKKLSFVLKKWKETIDINKELIDVMNDVIASDEE